MSKRKFTDPFLALDQSDDQDASSLNSEFEESESDKNKNNRLKMAKDYIKKLKTIILSDNEKTNERDDKEITKKITKKLNLQGGISTLKIAQNFDKLLNSSKFSVSGLTKHSQTVTAIDISPDGKFLFSGSKDGSISKFDLTNQCKVKTIKKLKIDKNISKSLMIGHSQSILCVVVNKNGKILATGGKDRNIIIWTAEDLSQLHCFRGHRDSINSLAFSNDNKKLYSASKDSTIKSFNTETMTYIETLHGHEASITQIAAKNNQNKILSCGEDKTIRVFKIDAGTQLVFKAFSVHSAAIDCCCFLNKSDFIVGSQDGSLSLWTENSKKPIFVEKRAHDGKWITALAIFGGSENKWSDLVATGSSDGFLRFWRILGETGNTQIKQIGKVKLEGYINSLKFNVSRNSLLVGVGREHRFGRWEVIKMAKNQVFEILFD